MSEVEDKLRDLLQSLEREREKEKKAEAPNQLSEKELKAMRVITERYKSYCSDASFKVGDIVKWKKGMRNRRFPDANGVAIVTKVYPNPIYDDKSKDSGTPNFHDPMTVVLGVIDEDGDFVEFHFDGNRFEIASGSDVSPRTLQLLRDRHQAMCAVEHFQPGDIVIWKQGLRNKKHPVENTAALVVKVYDHPIYDTGAGAGSPYFNEPLGFVIGIIDDDGDFLCFHSDPRRFTHVPPL